MNIIMHKQRLLSSLNIKKKIILLGVVYGLCGACISGRVVIYLPLLTADYVKLYDRPFYFSLFVFIYKNFCLLSKLGGQMSCIGNYCMPKVCWDAKLSCFLT